MYFEHNIEIFQRFEPVILEHHECCLVGTMGTGKTDISIEFIKKYNQKALIIVPSVYLGKQWKDVAEKNDISTLSVVTYHTFSKAFAVLAAGYDCYIFDEAHHMDSPVWGKAIRKFREMIDKSRYIIGLTGDPIRYFDSCKNVVDTMFHGHVVYGLDQYDAIMKGILPNVIYVCAIYDTKGLYNKYRGMATTKHLQGKLNLAYENCKKINDILVSHAMNHMKGFVFVDKIESISSGVDLISKAFPDMPVYSAHSKMTKNEKTDNIDGFKNSNTGFMVSVNMFNEGHHVNGANTVIMLRKTGSPTIYAQQIGRALSANHSGTAIIYDFVANSESMKSIGKRISTIRMIIGEELDKLSDKNSERNDRISNQIIIHDYSRDLLEVIEEIDDAHSKILWTQKEDQILRDNYPKIGRGVYKLLPGRSVYACKARATKLGLRYYEKTGRWTEDEIKILTDNYPTMGPDIADMLPYKNKDQCVSRAYYMGLAHIRRWTEDEIKILTDNYPTMGPDVADMLPGRSRENCKSKALMLNIKYVSRVYKKWTQEEDEILRKHYPILGCNVYELLPGRTSTMCRGRASKLKLRYENSNWSEDEDRILRSNYPSMGLNVQTLLPNRTINACVNRARLLKINVNKK